MKDLSINYTVLHVFKLAILRTNKEIQDLLIEQRELGLRKKSENWLIFLSNFLRDICDLTTCIKNNGSGYKYLELRLGSTDTDVEIVCHLQYLKKRTRLPRKAVYRDVQRKKNPSIQQEFADTSFYRQTQKELYYLFCFGEDEAGLFGIFYQPDGQLPCYYAKSKNCMDIDIAERKNPDTITISEEPDKSVFNIKETIIQNLVKEKA
ncbi:hypothetical protein [Treponema phagedenis]|uniref:hypothetical protein n=1 Tax=Treponema phagedenis TaxID=162 RepID=UPI0001F63BD7|nr:hypothetical protein [Treponema phagedenis]EFW38226.1 hypothetical protein HMPREF9554_01274 [Treponema phagedenis F0421]TYT78023.1 hypothetical protein FS559_02230 [Treponema phagedenis]